MQKEGSGGVLVKSFNYGNRVGIQWQIAVQMSARDFQLAQATFNLTE